MVAVTDTAVTVALSAAGAAMANCWQSLRLSRPRLAAVAITAMAAILILLRRCSAANKENSLSSKHGKQRDCQCRPLQARAPLLRRQLQQQLKEADILPLPYLDDPCKALHFAKPFAKPSIQGSRIQNCVNQTK